MADGLVVDYYYDKLLDYGTGYKKEEFIRKQDIRIKRELGYVIDSNYNYLLSDSFLCYLSRQDNILRSLEFLHTNDADRIKLLSNYFDVLLSEKYRYTAFPNGASTRNLLKYKYFVPNKVNYSEPYSLLDNKAKEVISLAVTKLQYAYHHIVKFNAYTSKVLCIVIAYCYINNKMDEFEELCSKLKLDTYYVLTDFEFNKIDIDTRLNQLIERVVNIIEMDSSKTIM